MEILAGNVAVVTGAASGIGRALAVRFVAERMKVVLSDVDVPAVTALAAELTAGGADVVAVGADVSRLEDVEELARAAQGAFGKVHVVCNNAGVTKHTGEPVWSLTDNDWRWLLGVNLWGVVHGLRVFVPILIAQGEEAHVVNTASMAGLVVTGSAYGVVKHAVVALSEALHVELVQRAPKIGVTCLCPGLVATNIVDSERRRPAALRNVDGETPEQREHRERVATFTREQGMSPADVADVVVAAIRARTFYACTDDPPTVVPGDERIRARLTAILERRDPVAVPLRRREGDGGGR